MKYNLEKTKDLYDENNNLKYLFFWGHSPSKDGSITKTCFSQWWESKFTVDNIKYPSAEHWMMAEKARLFEDNIVLEKIISSKSPASAKKLGREVNHFIPKIWEEKKYEIVKQGNLHKFSQNQDLKAFLLNTNDRIIVEASPLDTIWGIGLSSDNPNSLNPHQWKGENLLGFALMEVRDILKESAT